MPAYSKGRAPASNRHLRLVHGAIASAVRAGKFALARRVLANAPVQYRAVVALLAFYASMRKSS